MRLIDTDTGHILANDIGKANSFWARFRGLMFRRNFGDGKALIFEIPEGREFGVHTFFVFFPIDLVYLDENMKVIDIKSELGSWSTYKPEVEGGFLVEFPAGVVEKHGVEISHELEFEGK